MPPFLIKCRITSEGKIVYATDFPDNFPPGRYQAVLDIEHIDPCKVSKLTPEDREMIGYFHSTYGDVTRWTRWEKVLPIIREEYPELLVAMNHAQAAKFALDDVVKRINNEF